MFDTPLHSSAALLELEVPTDELERLAPPRRQGDAVVIRRRGPEPVAPKPPRLADADLRRREQEFLRSGADADHAALIRARVARGLSDERVRLAAALGHSAARAVTAPAAGRPAHWQERALASLTQSERVAFACDCAGRVQFVWQAHAPDDYRPEDALIMARAWLADPFVHAGITGAARCAVDAARDARDVARDRPEPWGSIVSAAASAAAAAAAAALHIVDEDVRGLARGISRCERAVGRFAQARFGPDDAERVMTRERRWRLGRLCAYLLGDVTRGQA